MRAAVLQAGGRFAVKELPDPVPTGRQAVLRVIYCGICGSDLHALRAGTLPFGAVLGHEIVGEITALGPDARGFEVGDRVTTLSAVPCDSCAKCAAGLAVIVLIAVIGATDRGDRGAVSHVAAGTPASVQPAQQHRKQVFDGRRARFQGYAERRSVAGATEMPENHSRVVLR